jgi:hypothetical protein
VKGFISTVDIVECPTTRMASEDFKALFLAHFKIPTMNWPGMT